MAARVEFHGRCVPCKRAVDGCAGVGVFHLASDAAVVQRLTISNIACGDSAVRLGVDLVHRVDLDSQIDVLIVGGSDRNHDRADFSCQAAGLIHVQQ